jgi:putative ABC transport system permease protein
MHTLWQDIRFALRTLRKSPGFTAVAVFVITLGIGINATVFTLANAVLFKNLPFDNSDHILYIEALNRTNGDTDDISYPDFRDYRSQVKSFDGLGAMSGTSADISDKTGTPERYHGYFLSANSFSLIGQKPVAGRDFLPEDERPGAPPVAILSYGLWETRYAKDPGVIGRSIRLNEKPTVIIGVMAPGLQFPNNADLWMPLIPTTEMEKREFRNFTLFGRLARNSNLKSAGIEMDTLSRRLSTEYSATNKDFGVTVKNFNDFANGGKIRVVFVAMLGAVGFVLLIACANVANLMLGRAVGRSREISIRTALGASRWRIIRQLLVESVIISIVGGALGWLIALWGIRVFDSAVSPLGKPPFIIFTADYTVLAYIAAITLGTGILFGLAPALRLSRMDINLALKDGGHGTSGALRGKYLSAILVVAEMSLAVVLLAGAGLMIRSFLKLYQMPLGANTDHVLSMRLLLRDSKYPNPSDEIAFHQLLTARMQALPGVEAVALTSNLPAGGSQRFDYELEGKPPVDERKRPHTDALVISPDYFRVVRVVPRAGRAFTEADGVTGYPVVIVNDAFASSYWPSEDPLGKRLRLVAQPVGAKVGTPATPQPWLTVVGVVQNIVQNNVGENEREPIIYVPFRQRPQRGINVIARTQGPPAKLGDTFRRQVQALDEDLPVFNLSTIDDFLERRNWPWRIFGTMFGIFAAIALLLASVGLYAVIAHSVGQRTQEIGVRIAIGASRWNILRLIFGQGMRQLGIGLVVGLAAAFGVTRVLSSLLVGISPTDPMTFTIVALVLTIAGMFGCLIPARRALRVDPVVALRHE